MNVGGLEPPTPCLQIQKANLDGEAENEQKLHKEKSLDRNLTDESCKE